MFGTPKVGTCPKCGPKVPLIGTFEVKFKEYFCMQCEWYFEYLSAVWSEPTTQLALLRLRYRELFAQGLRSLDGDNHPDDND